MTCTGFSPRRASLTDCRAVYEIANDPTVRANSFTRQFLDWNRHRQWFSEKLSSLEAMILVARDDGGRIIGYTRLEIEEDMWCISFALRPLCQGKGLGSCMIASAIQNFREIYPDQPVVAFVLKDNHASQRALVKSGFVYHCACSKHGLESVCYMNYPSEKPPA